MKVGRLTNLHIRAGYLLRGGIILPESEYIDEERQSREGQRKWQSC
jgi:hypothetical protein